LKIVDGVLVRQTLSLGPAVIGSFPSIIVLPAWVRRLEADCQQLVLAHEQEHIRAGDIKLLLGGLFAAVLLPWNLPLWWQLRRLRDAVELDCDDRVIKSGADPRVYGELLLEVARHRSAVIFPAAALSNPKSLLARRIHKMMHPNPRARTARAGIAAAVATLLVALACETPMPAAVEIDQELGTITTVSFVYGEADVDKRPERKSGPLPRYPALLRQAGIEGNVMVEFVITPEGKVDSSSVNVVESTNRAFEAPAMHVIRGSLYSPGEVDGAQVSTLVSQQIRFSLAGGSARRTATALLRGAISDSPRPLVVVDGVILGEFGDDVLPTLNPVDIARIEVVKGDAAVTMWGERAANGVIQIFTKSATGVSARRESN
jgi:TonB family protein